MNIKKVKPLPGQESVWDYPRPPRLEPFSGQIRIVLGGSVICDSHYAMRILETSHPPTYYIPFGDFKANVLRLASGQSFCEFKGMAHYYDMVVEGQKVPRAAWGYAHPNTAFEALKEKVCVYAQYMDACYVNDERVQAQPGDFYGGWINSWITGPFKGAAGTWGW